MLLPKDYPTGMVSAHDAGSQQTYQAPGGDTEASLVNLGSDSASLQANHSHESTSLQGLVQSEGTPLSTASPLPLLEPDA